MAKQIVQAEDVGDVFEAHVKYHPREKLTKKKRDLIKNRLRDGYSVDDLCMAILGIHNTPHNLGDNDRKTKYLGLHVSMRSENVDRFIETGEEVFERRKKEMQIKKQRRAMQQSREKVFEERTPEQKEKDAAEFREMIRKELGR